MLKLIKIYFPKIIAFILRYWRIILEVLMVLAILFYKTRYESIANELEAYKLKQAQEYAEQVKKNELERIEREKIDFNVLNAYTNSVEQLKEYYAKNPNVKYRTIRVSNEVCSNGVPALQTTTEGIDGRTNGTSENVTINFEKAGIEIIQCQNLIEWAKEQSEVK